MPNLRLVPVLNFSGYRARSDGFILSLRRGGAIATNTVWRVLTPIIRDNKKRTGYRCVTLFKNGVRHQLRISRLMLESFIGPCPNGMEASHENGNSLDDRIENLAWKTHPENEADKSRHGTLLMGEECYLSTHCDQDVSILWEMVSQGYSGRQIANTLGTTPNWVNMVYRGRIWKHLRPSVIPPLAYSGKGPKPSLAD